MHSAQPNASCGVHTFFLADSSLTASKVTFDLLCAAKPRKLERPWFPKVGATRFHIEWPKKYANQAVTSLLLVPQAA